MKKVTCDLDMISLYRETEGVAWDGWFCPVWASIDKKDKEISVSLGAPSSKGTSFVDNDGKYPLSWVGNIECWKRTYGEDDAEQWAEDNECSEEDFDCDEAFDVELDCMDFSSEEAKIKENITAFAKSEGYDVEFI